MTTSSKTKTKKSKLNMLLSSQMQKKEKTLKQVADYLGYRSPCSVSNMVTGSMKIPLPIIVPLSKCLGIDPKTLLKLAHPEYYNNFVSIFGANDLTESEKKIIATIRESTKGYDITLNEDETEQLVEIVQSAAKREEDDENTAINDRNRRRARYGHDPLEK